MFSSSSRGFFLSVLSLAAALAPSGCVGEAQDEFVQEDGLTDDAAQEIKGVTAVASAYPEAVLLDMKVNGQIAYGCSGTVIAPRVVLTAGHCVVGISGWDVVAPYAGHQTASSVRGLRLDYTDLSEYVNANQHDVGLVFLDRDIVLSSYPTLAGSSVAGSSILNIGRVNNGAFSNADIYVSQPVTSTSSASWPYDYYVNSVIIEGGDSGGADVLPGPAPHTIVAVNSGAGATFEVLARVDLVKSWIQDKIAANSGGVYPIDDADFFVRQAYRDVLGREGDAGGIAFFLQTLTACNGAPACVAAARVAVARTFLESSENRAQYPELSDPASSSYKSAFLKHCYWNFLGHEPDAAGFNWWLNTLTTTNDYNAVISGFITSTEYRKRFGAQ